MNPDLLLGLVTALTGFILKTTLAFGVCLVLSWLASSPGRRFLVWLTFLYGTAGYWLFLTKGFLAGSQVAVLSSPGTPVRAVAESARVWHIPDSWAFPLGISLRVLGVAYLLGLAYLVVAHIKKHIQLKWVLGFTSQPPDGVMATFQVIARRLGVGRSRLLVLAGVASPATFGWIRPTILLPETCLEQDGSGLEDILRHELHHVRRLDFLWNGIALGCRALLFFHPAAWYAVHRMQFERELACDLAVVSGSPQQRARYAECLIQFARLNSSPNPTSWGIDFASSSDQLKARIHSILAESKKSPAWLIGSRVACGLALLSGFVAVAPSLGVLLAYAQRQIVQPLAVELRTARPEADNRTLRTNRKGKLQRGAALPIADVSPADVSQAPESAASAAPQNGDRLASTSSTQIPQLLHRGEASAKPSRQQTVIPIDDPSGTGKAGDRDHQQALQQTATAAAVLKRLSTFDRH